MSLAPEHIQAIILTLKLAATTTGLLIVLGTPLAWWLAFTQRRGKVLVEVLVALPLVLPPTVLGFYLLVMLGPSGPAGPLLDSLGMQTLAFSFWGLVCASLLYSLPFVVQPLQNAFMALGRRPLEVAATLGAGRVDQFFSIALPLCWPGYMTAMVLGFAHTVGEFGLVLMIGGNIPGETQVLSILIYDYVEATQYQQANLLAGGLLAFSVLVLLVVYTLNQRRRVLVL